MREDKSKKLALDRRCAICNVFAANLPDGPPYPEGRRSHSFISKKLEEVRGEGEEDGKVGFGQRRRRQEALEVILRSPDLGLVTGLCAESASQPRNLESLPFPSSVIPLRLLPLLFLSLSSSSSPPPPLPPLTWVGPQLSNTFRSTIERDTLSSGNGIAKQPRKANAARL